MFVTLQSLPKSFSSTYLPKSNEYLTLIDEDGNEFQSLYLAPKNGLSGGWRGFSMEHDLVDGDALIFELINPKTFKVIVFTELINYYRFSIMNHFPIVTKPPNCLLFADLYYQGTGLL